MTRTRDIDNLIAALVAMRNATGERSRLAAEYVAADRAETLFTNHDLSDVREITRHELIGQFNYDPVERACVDSEGYPVRAAESFVPAGCA